MKHSPSLQSAAQEAAPAKAVLKLLALGFTQSERQMLDAVVQLSQRRQPQIKLLNLADVADADVVMIDAADTHARQWSANGALLQGKAVIWVDSTDAPGRSVVQRPVQWAALPMLLARVLEHTSPNPTVRSPAAAGYAPVLVVDDSMAVRAQLRALLETHGLEVAEVDSAEAAIKSASEVPYACILLDVLMPGMDGYEACRRIKANTRGGSVPNVVMLTSKSSPFDRIRGKMAGCDAYLTKPIDPEHLYEVVSRFTANSVARGAVLHGVAPAHFA